MSEWEIPFEEYLKRTDFSTEHFKKELNIPTLENIKKVVPLRSLRRIDSIALMKNTLLLKLIRQIKTDDNRAFPFANSTIDLVKIDPKQVKVGQKFVYREKYIDMIENLPRVFDGFSIGPGFSNLGALIVFGTDQSRNCCLSYYIPPMVERHKNDLIVMDGFHRNFLTRQMGATLITVVLENINTPFPCSPHFWDETKTIPLGDRPQDVNKRYFDLNKNLFRDLKYLGIDG